MWHSPPESDQVYIRPVDECAINQKKKKECVVKPHEANNIGSLLTDAKFEPHEANSIEDTGRWERLRTEWGVYKGHSECVVRECVLRVAAHEANSIEDTGSLLTDVQVASAHEALNDYNY